MGTLERFQDGCKSTGVAEAGGDAAYCRGDGTIDFGGVFAGALAAEQVYLDQVHGVDVWITQLDGAAEDLVGLKQISLFCHGEKGSDGAMKFGFEHVVDAFAEL